MKILLGSFKDRADELVTFLEPRLGTKPKLSGGEIEIEDEGVRAGVKPRHVKTYLKRFLFRAEEKKKYRVLVQGRELRLVEVEGVKEEEEKKEEGKAAEEPAKKEGEKEKKEEPKEQKQEEVKAEKEQAEEKPKEEKQKKKPRKKSSESG